jgi:glycerol kinase
MNGFARGLWTSFNEVLGFRKVTKIYQPQQNPQHVELYQGWRHAVNQLVK